MRVHLLRPRTTGWMLVVIAAGLSLTGCTRGRWSPTGDAMSSAESRGVFGTQSTRGTGTAGLVAARPARRSLVLAEDGFSRMTAPPATFHDASNTTATAAVDPAN